MCGRGHDAAGNEKATASQTCAAIRTFHAVDSLHSGANPDKERGGEKWKQIVAGDDEGENHTRKWREERGGMGKLKLMTTVVLPLSQDGD